MDNMTATMLMVLAIMASGPRVGREGAVLKTGCGSDAERVAELAAGTELVVRFSMNGESGVCYKVAAGEVTGWLGAGSIEGLETFNEARRGGYETNPAAGNSPPVNKIRETLTARALAGSTRMMTPSLRRALDMLEEHQPKQALRLIEYSLMNENRKDPFALAVAGLAAYQSDELKRAIGYWKESLELEPNASVAQLLARAVRELEADTGQNLTRGQRFTLRYDGGAVPPHVANVMMDALDEEYRRIDAAIGCGGNEAITAIVLAANSYRASSGAAEWSAASYDGRIRVALPGGAVVTPDLRQTFAHEIVHACLARRGQFPVWFHEGLAQRLSGERLHSSQRNEIKAALKEGGLPPLSSLSGSWSGFGAAQARMAYSYALAAVELIYAEEGDERVREMVRSPGLIQPASERLTRRLGE